MTGKQLKNTILQLAIQGKLVPQDPSDEPASALLAQIRKEKEQLLKAGKLKKKDLETTPISDEEKPFEIPGSWEWCNVKDLLLKITDGTHNSPVNTLKGDYMYVTAKNIKDEGIVLNNITYVNETIHREIYNRCNPEKGDLLYIKDGATTGVVTINNLDEEFSMLSSVALLKPSANVLNKYLLWFLRSDYCYQTIRATMKGTGITRITLTKIEQWIIPLPPLAEQHRIVSKIEELMPLVEEYGAAQEKLDRLNEALPEALKKSILQQAIQGKLVPQDANDEPASVLLAKIRKEKEQLVKAGKLKKKDLETTPISDEEKPFEIPESWEWVRLGEIFKINMGQSPTGDAVSTAKNGIEFHQGKIKFGDKYIGVSDFTTTKPNKIAEPLDLLLCVRAPVGEVNITERKICIGRGLCGLTPTGKMPVNFWFYAMKTLIPIFNAKATGSTFVAISNDIIVNQIFPLPPLAEQKRIVTRVEELMELVEGMK